MYEHSLDNVSWNQICKGPVELLNKQFRFTTGSRESIEDLWIYLFQCDLLHMDKYPHQRIVSMSEIDRH
jgi:hypothetical protein